LSHRILRLPSEEPNLPNKLAKRPGHYDPTALTYIKALEATDFAERLDKLERMTNR
jgi:hypothetical protein